MSVVVVGLGAMGAAAAWRLAEAGMRTTGVDQYSPPHSHGSSHGESRIIRTAYMEHPDYVPLVRRAWALWRELEQTTGTSLLTPTGGLMLGPPDCEVVTGTLRAVAEHALPHEVLDTAELRRRFDRHVVDDDYVGVYEHDAGVLRPEAGVAAMLTAARAAGAELLTDVAATEVHPDGVVLADGRRLPADAVVLAVGAWSQGWLDSLDVQRRVQCWYPVAEPARFAPARFPVFIRWDAGTAWYGFPTLDGTTVKLAVHHAPGLNDPSDPQVGARPAGVGDAAAMAPLVARLRGVWREPARMTPCRYTLTPHGHFVVDRWAGLVLLAGFSGHGFKFAPAVGELAVQLVGGAPAPPLFAVSRITAGSRPSRS
jgi:sarcosine oxidase